MIRILKKSLKLYLIFTLFFMLLIVTGFLYIGFSGRAVTRQVSNKADILNSLDVQSADVFTKSSIYNMDFQFPLELTTWKIIPIGSNLLFVVGMEYDQYLSIFLKDHKEMESDLISFGQYSYNGKYMEKIDSDLKQKRIPDFLVSFAKKGNISGYMQE